MLTRGFTGQRRDDVSIPRPRQSFEIGLYTAMANLVKELVAELVMYLRDQNNRLQRKIGVKTRSHKKKCYRCCHHMGHLERACHGAQF